MILMKTWVQTLILSSSQEPAEESFQTFSNTLLSNAEDRVYALRLDGRACEWNLDELRRELAKLILDWQDSR